MSTLLLLVACGGPASAPPLVADTDDTGPVETFQFEASPIVPLAYVTVGEPPPDGTITLSEVGGVASVGGVVVTVDGAFAVGGELGPLPSGATRALTVRWTGPTDIAGSAEGVAHVTIDGQTADVVLAAVIGDPAIPESDWTTDAWGTHTIVALPSAPWAAGGAWEDASVLISVPDGLGDAGGVHVVTHFHGWGAVIERTVAAHALVEQHSLSGRDAVLIVPQGPLDASSGDFGALLDDGGHATLVRDVIALLYRDGFVDRPTPGLQVLTSHSGGYQAAAAVLDHGGLPIHAVHLFDSLYGNEATFADFAEGGGVFRSLTTCCGGTDEQNAALAARLDDAGVTVDDRLTDDALRTGTVTIAAVGSTHDGCVTDQRSYARLLAASSLPRREGAPIEVRAVIAEGDRARVTWLADGVATVEGSDDGVTWTTLGTSEGSALAVAAKPWIRVSGSDVYGATGADWLVVDGFDRVLDGSWSSPTHDFAASVGNALGAPFSTCSDEAIASGEVDLADYAGVLWLLGDEGTADITLDEAARDAIGDYLAGGGAIVASGSEVGYATDGAWLSAVLHASYVADDAGTTELDDGATFGVAYPEDYPDVLSGEDTLLRYATGGAAAVGFDHRGIVVGFPLETLDEADRADVVGALTAWLAP